MNFAVFYADGSGEYQLRRPRSATFDFAIIDDTPDGDVITAGVGTVVWTFEKLTEAEYDAIKNRRGAKGLIRLRTLNDNRAWVICQGHVDPNPAPPNFFRGEVIAPAVTFRRVEVV